MLLFLKCTPLEWVRNQNKMQCWSYYYQKKYHMKQEDVLHKFIHNGQSNLTQPLFKKSSLFQYNNYISHIEEDINIDRNNSHRNKLKHAYTLKQVQHKFNI